MSPARQRIAASNWSSSDRLQNLVGPRTIRVRERTRSFGHPRALTAPVRVTAPACVTASVRLTASACVNRTRVR